MPLTDPVTAGQLQKHGAIQATRRPVIDILDGGQMTQLGDLGAAFETLLLASCARALEKNAEPFRMPERLALRIARQVVEALGHAVQPELAQPVKRWMSEQCQSPNGNSGSRGCCRAEAACRPRPAATPVGRGGV